MIVMSAVVAVPALIAAAADKLAAIDSTLIGAAPIQAVAPAAADEVSQSIAHLFSQHAQDYQKVAGQAAAYSQQFVQHLSAAARAYAGADAANASVLGTAAVGLPSFDSLVDTVTTLFFQVAAAAYYLLFPILLPPIFLALALWLPLAFLGSIFPV